MKLKNFTKNFTQKAILSVMASTILASNALASGIPTFDAVGLATSVKQFMEQAKQYEQMLQQFQQMKTQTTTLLEQAKNSKAMLEENGIGLSLDSILGQSKALIQSTQDLYGGAKISEDTFQETADLTNVCKFLSEKSSAFSTKIDNVAKTFNNKSKLENKVNACVAVANNDTTDLTAIINELNTQAVDAQLTDNQKAQELRHEAKTIETALAYLKGKQNNQKATKILAFYEAYMQGDENNPYSKAKFDNDLKTLATQLNQANNTKQSQVLTNTMLLKLLEVAQKQYELQLNYNNMMAQSSSASGGGSSTLDNLDYTAEVQYETTFEDTFKEELEEAESVVYDDSGLPSFKAMLDNAFKSSNN